MTERYNWKNDVDDWRADMGLWQECADEQFDALVEAYCTLEKHLRIASEKIVMLEGRLAELQQQRFEIRPSRKQIMC